MSQIALKLESFLKRTNTFIRFLLVGFVNTLTGLSIIFILINVFDWTYWPSTMMGNVFGASISYFLNKTITFQSHIHFKKGALKFITVIVICYFVSFSASEWFAGLIFQYDRIELFFTKDELAILLGSAFYTLTNYFGQKLLVFRS
jgi:putative flippase GtrA